MVLKVLRLTLVVAAVMAAWSLFSDGSDQAFALEGLRKSPGLFYNYYAPPGPYGGVGAQLYVCPLPTPPLVGHTYVTYEPLMPHEFLYRHSRTYLRRHPGGGWTKTIVTWQ